MLRVAVIRLPCISNFTDIDALALEPGVAVRFVTTPAELADADLVVVPGTRATVADLGWLRRQGLDGALKRRAADRKPILAICGGYQMLGTVIHDDVESAAGAADGSVAADGVFAGLGLLPVVTRFAVDKTLGRPAGYAGGIPVSGYEIHHGLVDVRGGEPWFTGDPGGERPAAVAAAGRRSTAAATARSAAPCGTGSWRTTSSAGPISPRPPGSRAGTSPPRPIPPSPPPGRRSSTRSPTPSKSTSTPPPCCGSSSRARPPACPRLRPGL